MPGEKLSTHGRRMTERLERAAAAAAEAARPENLVSARAHEIELEEMVAQRLGQGLDKMVTNKLYSHRRIHFLTQRDFGGARFLIGIAAGTSNPSGLPLSSSRAETATYEVTDETLTAQTASVDSFQRWMGLIGALVIKRFKPFTVQTSDPDGWMETRPVDITEWKDHVIQVDSDLERIGFRVVENSLGTVQLPEVDADEVATTLESIRRAMG